MEQVKARIVQYIMRGIAFVMVAIAARVAPLPPEQWVDANGDGIIQPGEMIQPDVVTSINDWAQAAAFALVALIFIIVDLVIHKIKTGKWFGFGDKTK